MSHESVLGCVQDTLGELCSGIHVSSPQRIYVDVPPEHSVRANRLMFEKLQGRLATATGCDARDRVEVLYHYCMDRDGVVVTIRTWANKPELRLDSVAPFLPAADWIEREIHDLLGVVFVDHPDPRRLILADEWPEGVFPLRRDFPDRVEKPKEASAPETPRSAKP